MSILSYKRTFINLQPQPAPMPGTIIDLPNVPPPVPPIPPNPPINPINGTLNDTSGVIYNKISNKIIDNTSNLLNGLYVTKNINTIPENLITQNILNINRFTSGTINNLAITDSGVSLTTNINIYFWVYVIYNGNLTRPMTILTKGNSQNYGEYTIQILPNRLLSFFYTNNGVMYNLRSVSTIQERTLTLVSIIKTQESVGIYFNNRSETVQRMLGISTATNNPLLIGSGYNSVPLNGFIDNLMINNMNNGDALIPVFFSYTPTSIVYQFSNGILTYNGFNVLSNISGTQPINIESAKFISTQLENFTNGFSLSNGNQYIFYINYINTIPNDGGAIFEKINTLNMANNIFTKLLIDYEISKNVSFEEFTLINGYIKAYTGEIFYFIDGIIYEFNVSRNVFVISNLTELQAFNILSIITSIISFRFLFDRYQFYSSVTNVKENNPGLINTYVKKICNYIIGGINSIIDLDGHSNAGTYRFNSNVQYFNTFNTTVRNIEENKSNEIFINNALVFHPLVEKDNSILKRTLLENTTISDPIEDNNSIYVYIGKNILSLMNTSTDIFVDNLPSLDLSIPFQIVLDTEVDIIDTLMSVNIPMNRQIVIQSRVHVSPRLFNFSIVSNTYTKILINNKEYVVNTNSPKHIVFHCSNKIIDIEIQIYYDKINQVCKFVLI